MKKIIAKGKNRVHVAGHSVSPGFSASLSDEMWEEKKDLFSPFIKRKQIVVKDLSPKSKKPDPPKEEKIEKPDPPKEENTEKSGLESVEPVKKPEGHPKVSVYPKTEEVNE